MEYGLVVLWLAAYLALGAAALPLAAVLFTRLPDRGAAVSVPLALVLVTVPAYWVGQVAFGPPALAVGLLVLVGAGALAHVRFDAAVDREGARDAAVVFALAFGLMVAIRAVDPAVHPIFGEKFLDFGLVKSLLRAPALPPEDMWFAGEPVKYYYGGHLVTALLSMLTGTTAAYAYNLALAGFYAMLATAAFGIGSAVASARGATRRGGGIAAVFFVAFASNLSPAGRLLVSVLPESLRSAYVPEDAGSMVNGIGGFSYWPASRIIEGTINEFPLFAWLNGDLHAHMTSTPFTLLVVALVLAYYRTPEPEVHKRRLLVLSCVPVAGLVGVVNTWSFPTVGGLTALAVLFAPADPTTMLPDLVGRRLRAFADGAVVAEGTTDRPDDAGAPQADGGLARPSVAQLGVALDRSEVALRRELVRVLTAGVAAATVLVGGLVVAAPFFTGPASGREVALLSAADRSGLVGLLLVHGGLLVVFAAFLRSRLHERLGADAGRLALPLAVLFGFGLLQRFPALGLFGALVLVGWVLLRTDGPDAAAAVDGGDVGFETLLVVAGAGLATIVEVAYVVEDAGPLRMNTVFKTYAQVWILWGTAAGAMFAVLVREHVLGPLAAAGGTTDDGASAGGPASEGPRPAAVAASVLLVLSLSLYGGLAVTNHLAGASTYDVYQTADDPTLNATAFVEEGHPEEAAAIRWLDAREGTPVIVTAAPGGYRWDAAGGKGASAPSSLTGLPTVAGWFHERGYRGSGAFSQRVDDVRTIYTGDPAERACLLAAYDVEYVYVGPAERARYGDQRVTAFDSMEGLSEPRRFGDVLIYEVDQDALATGANCEGQ